MMPTIKIATIKDAPAISALLQKYQQDQHGGLFGNFPLTKTTTMLKQALTVVVAYDNNEIVGVVFASPTTSEQPAIIKAMLTNYTITTNHYLYGPVCIDSKVRGQGIIKLMYQKLQQVLPHQHPLLFIRQDNTASTHAHHKLGLINKGQFTFENQHFLILSD